MTDLRIRIAATVDAHERVGASCKCGFSLGVTAIVEHWQEHLAAAVIRELGLEVEDGECGYCQAQLPGCRYVTEWIADE